MKNDTLIRIEGMKALMEKLGLVEAERFITLINQEPFDYTRWREGQFNDECFDTVYAEAVANYEKNQKLEKAKKATASRKPVTPSRKVKATPRTTTASRRKIAKRPLAHA